MLGPNTKPMTFLSVLGNHIQASTRDRRVFGCIRSWDLARLISSSPSLSRTCLQGSRFHPGLAENAFAISGKLLDAKVTLNGGCRITFLRPDGYFSFHNISAGTHLIEVAVIGSFFSPVLVDVSARNPGKVQAALIETRRSLSELILEPLREEHYYEIREPFSIISSVKSPMGLMVGFMLFAVFLMPKLAENMDPEEVRRTQEEMRIQGVPSLANMLAGAAQ